MTSKEAFKKIDWLIGQNISKLKFDKKCNSTNEMVSCLLIIQRDLEKLDYYRQDREIVGDFEKGTTKLWWEHIRIIVDDKTKEIWQYWEGAKEDKTITLNGCLEIAKKELDYKTGVILIICESYLKGIIYRYGNYANCKDFEIAGRMHGFA